MKQTPDRAMRIKQYLKTRLSPERRAAVRKRFGWLAGFLFRDDLRKLALIHGSDKWGEHWYARHYMHHFRPWRRKKLTLLEVGIGGYHHSTGGANSLRMWKQYFPKGQIAGIDIYDKSYHNAPRLRTFQGDQTDEKFLQQVIAEIGRPEIIIDDGSHINSHVIKTFEVLFPLLADNGIYVVEDTQTSYWEDHGGTSDNIETAPTMMCFFKRMIDGLNHEELIRPGYQASYYDKHIVSMHFYHNLIFIYKGSNNEGSNLVRNHQRQP